jgi:hypothetical protein
MIGDLYSINATADDDDAGLVFHNVSSLYFIPAAPRSSGNRRVDSIKKTHRKHTESAESCKISALSAVSKDFRSGLKIYMPAEDSTALVGCPSADHPAGLKRLIQAVSP